MATVSKWTPFGVALDVTATGSSVVRTSATQFTVAINASWKTYWEDAKTNYGMTATSGGVTKTISAFDGTKRSSGSTSFTGTYSISGNGAATKSITVTFKNFNTDNGDSASKSVSFDVNVPAWTSYTVSYNANGGSGAPGNQTKWKDQTLTLSSIKPTRTGHTFQGWATSKTGNVAYSAGEKYTANASVVLYAVWKANTFTVKYDANGGNGAPSTQTKTYGVTLKLSTVIPSRDRYNFLGWGTSASSTAVTYAAGGNYTANAAVTLYAIWELAYVKPSISNLTVNRCNSSGTVSDTGEYARVSFDWSSTESNPSIIIRVGETIVKQITGSGISGSVNTILSDTFSTDASYTIGVTVSDPIDSYTVKVPLNGTVFPIDVLSKGKGVAFGKPAELSGYADFNFIAKHRKNVVLDNNIVLYGRSTDDANQALLYINASDDINVGYGGYRNSIGATYLYGNAVNITSRTGVYVNGKQIAVNNVLWSGGYYMSEAQTCTLNSAISSQANGIVLVWSEYNSTEGSVVNANFNTCFVPKHFVSAQSGRGVALFVISASLNGVASKYVYISDTTITGYANNNAEESVKSSGIKTTPKNFVLRYVIGV